MLFPNPERMRSGSILAMIKVRRNFGRISDGTLHYMFGIFNLWDWPAEILGPAPKNWEKLPNYRKPWMPDDILTREDYIRPYMYILYDMGIRTSD